MDDNQHSNEFQDFAGGPAAKQNLSSGDIFGSEDAENGSYPACIATVAEENQSAQAQTGHATQTDSASPKPTFASKLKRRKKPLLIGTAAVLVLLLAAGAVGMLVKNQRRAQKNEERVKIAQAQSQMLAVEAQQKNIALIDEATVKQNIYNALGADEGSVTFQSILLSRLPKGELDKAKDKDDADDDRDDFDYDERKVDKKRPLPGKAPKVALPDLNSGATAATDGAKAAPDNHVPPAGAPANDTAAAAAVPGNTANAGGSVQAPGPAVKLYYQVQCRYDGLNYLFSIDGINGNILSYKISG